MNYVQRTLRETERVAVTRHYSGTDLQDRPIVPFGGPVYVVKGDESQFKHKSKPGVL